MAQLKAEHNINITRHSDHPNLVQLKYGKVDNDFNNPLVKQCRGIILDESQDWRIIARPFDKFGNVGESYVPEINWSLAKIMEKLDGSLMILYHYDFNWHVATSGMPDAAGEVQGFGMSFMELFWDTWQEHHYSLPGAYEEDLTFMFELTSPYNKIVVRHAEPKLRLIGVRNRVTGREMQPHQFIKWDRAREFEHANNVEVLNTSFGLIDPIKQEGYVVVDDQFNRLKVKHPDYIKMHRMRDQLTPKGILESILEDKQQLILEGFPEWQGQFDLIRATVDGLAMMLEQTWADIKDTPLRKDFAFKAAGALIPAIMFMLLDKKIDSAREGLKFMQIDRLMAVLKVKELMIEGAIC